MAALIEIDSSAMQLLVGGVEKTSQFVDELFTLLTRWQHEKKLFSSVQFYCYSKHSI